MKKEEYEQYISPAGCYQHLLIVTPKFRKLMRYHGKFCKKCKIPFIPQPHYRKNYPGAYHYPTKTTCGFCVYDMDSMEHSEELEDENYGRDDGY